MRKRLIIGFAIIAILGVAAFLSFWLSYPRHNITPEAFEKIELGMNSIEVETLLQRPPGDYSESVLFSKRAVWIDIRSSMPDAEQFKVDKLETWTSLECHIEVGFDSKGNVVWKYQLPAMLIDESVIDKVRRWVGV